MRHHTKDKGDQGLGFVIAAMLQANIQVATLLSEHLPFDCIGISDDNRLWRVSVKYRTQVGNTIVVDLRSSWADSHGTHTKSPETNGFDVLAVYCPDTQQCYWLHRSEITTDTLSLRIEPSRQSNARWATDYTDPLRVFNAKPIGPESPAGGSNASLPGSTPGMGTDF